MAEVTETPQYPNQLYGWVREENGTWSLYSKSGTLLVSTTASSVTIPSLPGGSISVTDGSTTVDPATSVDFTSGATVTNAGGGVAHVAVDGGSQTDIHVLSKAVLDFQETPGGTAHALTITAVDQGAQTFTVTGNAAALGQYIGDGATFTVAGSTGNNGTYTCSGGNAVAGAMFDGTSTVITTVEAIPSAVADGHVGFTGAFYTATVDLPAGARVLEVVAFCVDGPWDAFASYQAGDTANPAGYQPFVTGPLTDPATGIVKPYDPTSARADFWTGQALASWADSQAGNGPSFGAVYYTAASWYSMGLGALEGGVAGVPYSVDDTLTAIVATAGAGGSTGHLVIDVIGFGIPRLTVNAVKT